VLDGGEINATAIKQGDGGTITLSVTGLVRVSGAADGGSGEPSLISANVSSAFDAVGGLVRITSAATEISNGGAISANPTSLSGAGTSGHISITTGRLDISSGGRITTTTFGAIDGGCIDVSAGTATISGIGSGILSESGGDAPGGGARSR